MSTSTIIAAYFNINLRHWPTATQQARWQVSCKSCGPTVGGAEFYFSLRHFGRLSHNCSKTRRNSIHRPTFQTL